MRMRILVVVRAYRTKGIGYRIKTFCGTVGKVVVINKKYPTLITVQNTEKCIISAMQVDKLSQTNM